MFKIYQLCPSGGTYVYKATWGFFEGYIRIYLYCSTVLWQTVLQKPNYLFPAPAPAPAPATYGHLKLYYNSGTYHKKYVSMEVFLHPRNPPNWLQYIFIKKDNFGSGSRTRIISAPQVPSLALQHWWPYLLYSVQCCELAKSRHAPGDNWHLPCWAVRTNR